MEKQEIGNATVILGDCLEVLPTLDKCDAVVTDPPYGIGIDRKMAKSSGKIVGKGVAKGTYEAFGWDDEPINKTHIDLLYKAGTSLIIFGGNYFELPPTKCWLLWDKEINGNFAQAEMAWTNLNKPVKLKRYMWNGMLRANNELRGDHPTQKPIGIMEWVINHLPENTKTIIDPFMGSGTTGVACMNLEKKFIGIERERKYFDIACKRIEDAQRQERLF
jgi:site-specific DNA-methyltransferase (adenine-specific)/modification methylase